MLPRFNSFQDKETRKKYRQMGYDACANGVDRKIADDFAVEYRSMIRDGWDEANYDGMVKQATKLKLKARKTSQ